MSELVRQERERAKRALRINEQIDCIEFCVINDERDESFQRSVCHEITVLPEVIPYKAVIINDMANFKQNI